ncbi:unnamed protein product [Protopolystoma xenopodis]|uniref:Galactosylgalactosylxylosylprotein 3-beta-glucuronosyltransferase n=1 Tax=Protopolystoma xenopodis TaxID=117903 RepID=A0A3S5API4_9PLAT|nr:unnamed protein product [Protopolystoma xenopodis]
MRSTVIVSTWPVAWVGGLPWEGCYTLEGDRTTIAGMWTILPRTIPIDMAGFAIALNIILQKENAYFQSMWEPGHMETNFLTAIGLKDPKQMEPKANGCQEVNTLS